MRLVVITPERPAVNEVALANSMLDRGLHYIHLRKPVFTAAQQVQYLHEIRPRHRNKIVLHQHHDTAQLAVRVSFTTASTAEEEFGADQSNLIMMNSLGKENLGPIANCPNIPTTSVLICTLVRITINTINNCYFLRCNRVLACQRTPWALPCGTAVECDATGFPCITGIHPASDV